MKKVVQQKKPRKNLTPKQKKFADKYIENGGNGSKAAKETYNVSSDESARVVASVNLTKVNVQAYLHDKGELAGKIIETIMCTAEKEETRLKGAMYVYDQVNGKALSREEVTGKGGAPLIPDILLTDHQKYEIGKRFIAKYGPNGGK